jgi:hypothetical protein
MTIRTQSDPDNAPTMEITEAAIELIRRDARRVGFLVGLLVGWVMCLIVWAAK